MGLVVVVVFGAGVPLLCKPPPLLGSPELSPLLGGGTLSPLFGSPVSLLGSPDEPLGKTLLLSGNAPLFGPRIGSLD